MAGINQRLLIDNPRKLIRANLTKSPGCYSTVYYTHDPDIILKKGYTERDGWLLWAAVTLCYEKRHDFFPEIKKLVWNPKEQEYWALIKNYHHIKNGAYYDFNSIDGVHTFDLAIEKKKKKKWITKRQCTSLTQIHEYVSCLGNHNRPVVWDLHSHNYMQNPVTKKIIVTDPWCETNLQPQFVQMFHRLAAETSPRKFIIKE